MVNMIGAFLTGFKTLQIYLILLIFLRKKDIKNTKIGILSSTFHNVGAVRDDLALMAAGFSVQMKVWEYAATSMRLQTKEEIFLLC